MLSIKDLHSHYGLSHVIQGISLEVAAGEILGVFGRNGVGKTTLLKNIAGWVKPSSGSIELNGQAIGGIEPDAINRAGLAIVPEDRRIFPGLTVQENLELGLLGLKGAKPASKLNPVLERFPRLAERAKQSATTLSGGEQQMLSLARIMVAEPRVVLIDEPSEGLAPMIVAEIFAIVREMRDAGCAVVLVEQNIHEALAVCDRFVLIERGAVVFAGAAEDDAARAALLEKLAV
ncbi:ABC transporter ATP-binding protein [Pseudohoeflea coraliihabitans]|uniref:ABC transporter ATP-binding protein n=1 Tax=Pseudohoeflea coraliihabitans TaxID=2860393 RepID=A0ABS6WNN0_9HYPH|nr:ABC transporter ATP-binding protein [Pseudohoeflea sp. DP4N28-3]MBW3096674.1 ABC transporter ATP-binding protein [Pseudohoeflea sp. DP4N28-3]